MGANKKLDIKYHALGYATRMTPKKGGYVTPAPALDLTTSLRGDFLLGRMKNSIAFGKSTSQRIYREQHTPKIGWKLHKYRLKHALHTLDDHFR